MMDWKSRNWKFKTGIILIITSILFFWSLVVIPFLNIEKATKITLTSISFITAEVLFYLGGFLLGKELFNKYKALLNPKNWFKKEAGKESSDQTKLSDD